MDQARQIGLLDPEGSGSYTHPDLTRMLYADGKVVTPLFKAHPGDVKVNKETREVAEAAVVVVASHASDGKEESLVVEGEGRLVGEAVEGQLDLGRPSYRVAVGDLDGLGATCR